MVYVSRATYMVNKRIWLNVVTSNPKNNEKRKKVHAVRTHLIVVSIWLLVCFRNRRGYFGDVWLGMRLLSCLATDRNVHTHLFVQYLAAGGRHTNINHLSRLLDDNVSNVDSMAVATRNCNQIAKCVYAIVALSHFLVHWQRAALANYCCRFNWNWMS